jgi:hypothetical protein
MRKQQQPTAKGGVSSPGGQPQGSGGRGTVGRGRGGGGVPAASAGQRWSQELDSELLSLHREGRTQAVLATHFGRTRFAIFKRLEKLLEHGHDDAVPPSTQSSNVLRVAAGSANGAPLADSKDDATAGIANGGPLADSKDDAEESRESDAGGPPGGPSWKLTEIYTSQNDLSEAVDNSRQTHSGHGIRTASVDPRNSPAAAAAVAPPRGRDPKPAAVASGPARLDSFFRPKAGSDPKPAAFPPPPATGLIGNLERNLGASPSHRTRPIASPSHRTRPIAQRTETTGDASAGLPGRSLLNSDTAKTAGATETATSVTGLSVNGSTEGSDGDGIGLGDVAAGLGPEQRGVLEAVLSGRNVFISGGAGTGKSFLIGRIVAALPAETTFVTASTGLAAANIGGITVHSFAGVGLAREPVDQLIQQVRMRKAFRERWQKATTIIIDEISMLSADLWDKLEEIARVIRRSDAPFGGIQIVAAGDFLQLPPVVDGLTRPSGGGRSINGFGGGRGAAGRRSAALYANADNQTWIDNDDENDGDAAVNIPFCFLAKSWSKVMDVQVELNEVYRQSDRAFIDMLNELRFGCPSPNTIAALRDRLHPRVEPAQPPRVEPAQSGPQPVPRPPNPALKTQRGSTTAPTEPALSSANPAPVPSSITAPVSVRPFASASASVPTGLAESAEGAEAKSALSGAAGPRAGATNLTTLGVGATVEATRLYATRRSVEAENAARLAALEPGIRGHEFLAKDSGKPGAMASCSAPTKLTLKRGAQVVLLKNLDPDTGLVNGSRGVVVSIERSAKHAGMFAPRVQFANGLTKLIEREKWDLKAGDRVVGTRRQIPLALAWAITIHKSQGMTLDKAQVALAECFEAGQAYVAASRLRSLEGLTLLSFDPAKIRAHPVVVRYYRRLKGVPTSDTSNTDTTLNLDQGNRARGNRTQVSREQSGEKRRHRPDMASAAAVKERHSQRPRIIIDDHNSEHVAERDFELEFEREIENMADVTENTNEQL